MRVPAIVQGRLPCAPERAAARPVTVDTGGGVLDEFVGGAANPVMADPFAGAVVDIGLAVALFWIARRLLARRRSAPSWIAAVVALAAAASNLSDRLGLHRLTAPGSTRGVINWISWGGGTSSPMNVADLLVLAAGVVLGAVALVRFARRHEMPGRRRNLLVLAAVVVSAVSLAGAVHAASARRPSRLPSRVRPTSCGPSRRGATWSR